MTIKVGRVYRGKYGFLVYNMLVTKIVASEKYEESRVYFRYFTHLWVKYVPWLPWLAFSAERSVVDFAYFLKRANEIEEVVPPLVAEVPEIELYLPKS